MERKWREITAVLPELREAGIITAETAQQIEAYADAKYNSSAFKNGSVYFLGSLGALLMGTGVITLLASNWAWIPRWVQTVVAFIPLAVTGSFAVWSRERAWGKRPEVLEVTGIFWAASVFEAVALVARIYQLPSDGIAFLGASLVLLIPVVYATRGFTVTVAYLVASLAAGAFYWDTDAWRGLFFLFAFPALIGPVLWQKSRFCSEMPLSALELTWRWLLSLWVAVALAFALCIADLDRYVSEAWVWLIFLLAATVYAAGGALCAKNERRLVHRPLEVIGFWGVCFFGFFSSLAGFDLPRSEMLWLAAPLLLIMLISVCFILFKRPSRRYMLAIPAAAIALFCGALADLNRSDCFLFFAELAGLVGLCLLLTGLFTGRRLRGNVGLFFILFSGAAHVVAWNASLTFKGLSFIGIGLAFFGVNFFFSRLAGGEK